jgi:hypothetical protein
MLLILLIVFGIGSGICKAIADTCSHIDIWTDSIFNNGKRKETDFLGPKDKTWIRKDHDNKILNWLFHFPLVMFTDIWHLANAINTLFVTSAITVSLMMQFEWYLPLVYYIAFNWTFNLFYHKTFVK